MSVFSHWWSTIVRIAELVGKGTDVIKSQNGSDMQMP